jgi:uncharacterized membrane protein YtjA (UPF0391 family)
MDLLLTSGIVLVFIALIAYALGAKGVAGMSAGLGRMVLGVFLVLAVLVFLFRLIHGSAI